jgi:hypothetical protein
MSAIIPRLRRQDSLFNSFQNWIDHLTDLLQLLLAVAAFGLVDLENKWVLNQNP